MCVELRCKEEKTFINIIPIVSQHNRPCAISLLSQNMPSKETYGRSLSLFEGYLHAGEVGSESVRFDMKPISPMKSQMGISWRRLCHFFRKCGHMLKYLLLFSFIFWRSTVKIIVEVFRWILKKTFGNTGRFSAKYLSNEDGI